MEIPDSHLRHILLYYFRKGKKTVQARKKLYDVYDEKSLTERPCQNWFARFRSGDFHLKDAPRSGRPTEVDEDKIKTMIENNWCSTTREIAEKLNILNEIQLTKRISICDLLLKRNETDPFLKRIITGDEKWVVYDNEMRKRSWSNRDEPAQSTSKADIHQKKVMLSVWWDLKSIVYFELFPGNQNMNSNDYCRQLMKLNKEIKEKRPELATRKGIIFH